MNETNVIDHDPPTSDALALRRPDHPVTLSEIAAMRGEAVEIIEARVQVIETLRKASIRATSPEDWLLFKSPEEQGGQIVGYLQDAGCDRVRDLWGIEIFNVSKPEKVVGNDPGVFSYLITGSGRCKLTVQFVEMMEGGRSSTDDFCKGKTGVDLELAVRKAARANLDGGITRELAGMKSVPVGELAEAWTGTKKTIDQCRRGRGFGTRDERLGGSSGKTPDVEPPVCPHCGARARIGPARMAAARSTAARSTRRTPTRSGSLTLRSGLLSKRRSNQRKGRASATHAKVEPLDADDIFGRSGREPGQEG
jgi:hypothetical protein